MHNEVTITKMVGGGTSWYYLFQGNKVLGSAHEDDKEGMQRLRAAKQKLEITK